MCPKSNSNMGGGARAGPYDPSNAFVWIALVKEKRVYISQSVHVVLYRPLPPSEYGRMNNLSCYNPTGNVLGIYILSSRARG